MRSPLPALLLGIATACGSRSGLFVDDLASPVGSSGDGGAAVAAPVTRRTLSVSWDHACAIVDTQVACWGATSTSGVLSDSAGPYATPYLLGGLSGVVEVATGQRLTCVLLDDATVKCWGSAMSSLLERPVAFPSARRIFVGSATACVITNDGGVACVGSFSAATCGAASPETIDLSVTTVPLRDVEELAIGQQSACALEQDGSVWCWGCNVHASLGDPSLPSSDAPVRVPGIDAIHIAAETQAVCAVLRDGSAKCWGEGGQFGVSLTFSPTAPRAVNFAAAASDIDVGVVFACAAAGDTVRCGGALYDFDTGCADHRVDDRTFRVPGVREVSVGYQDACARDATGNIYCWGCNQSGLLGSGAGPGSSTPTRVPL